jgi:hypothetical protein
MDSLSRRVRGLASFRRRLPAAGDAASLPDSGEGHGRRWRPRSNPARVVGGLGLLCCVLAIQLIAVIHKVTHLSSFARARSPLRCFLCCLLPPLAPPMAKAISAIAIPLWRRRTTAHHRLAIPAWPRTGLRGRHRDDGDEGAKWASLLFANRCFSSKAAVLPPVPLLRQPGGFERSFPRSLKGLTARNLRYGGTRSVHKGRARRGLPVRRR